MPCLSKINLIALLISVESNSSASLTNFLAASLPSFSGVLKDSFIFLPNLASALVPKASPAPAIPPPTPYAAPVIALSRGPPSPSPTPYIPDATPDSSIALPIPCCATGPGFMYPLVAIVVPIAPAVSAAKDRPGNFFS